jgi:hypothetical protein
VACQAALGDHPAFGRGQLGDALLQVSRRRNLDAARAADPFPAMGRTGYCQDAGSLDAEWPGLESQEALRWSRDVAAAGRLGLGHAAPLGAEPASAEAEPAVELPVPLAQLEPRGAQPAPTGPMVRRLPSVPPAWLPPPQRAPQQEPGQLPPARRRPSWWPPSLLPS